MKPLPLLLCALFIAPLIRAEVDPKKVDAAVTASKTWITLVDAGHYDQSWDTAAAIFKRVMGKDRWIGQLTQVRIPLGKADSRELAEATYTETLPNAAKGEYVIVKFKTTFDEFPNAVETVSMTLDKDGQWKICGYFIKPAS
ncbi:MAG TPA: DUF4019 domain-containing protein [Opitutaceae bacterium]|nr:DUF4019 domain-containing protein [Opitutaceae bacterium]